MFLIISYIVLLAIWGLSFLPQLGAKRSFMTALCRALWLLPLIISFSPKIESTEEPRVLMKTNIHVLIDDSASMQSSLVDGRNNVGVSTEILNSLRSSCRRYGCTLKEALLSQENSLTQKGYTPLRQALSSWFIRVGQDPWIVLSDGGDSQPSVVWPQAWQSIAKDSEQKERGLLVGFPENMSERLWIESMNTSPLSFDGRAFPCDIVLKRKRKILNDENVQVQISAGDHVLLSQNINFPAEQDTVWTTLTVPALSRGQYSLEVRVLAPPGELVLWDKMARSSVEVVSNTLGILHLLGSPNWDGRYLRRYIKAEPKYDLISFFILRDPWDLQDASEKELSLIPFPVSRLFQEELVNFRVIVLQNFNLLQFLLPVYQQNLVNFVKQGGGLLFVGGARSLQSRDLQNSPLRELLPFTPSPQEQAPVPGANVWEDWESQTDKNGPWYDKDLSFRIKMANPEQGKSLLADVFDEWSMLAEQLGAAKGMSGMHHMENVKFKAEHTPLLDAVTSDGKKIPLAVASYPGKGRAIWIFTDQLWRLGLSPQTQISRSTYNKFMESSFSWLLRQDFRKPLSASRFQLHSLGANASIDWSVWIQGQAVHYFEPDQHWRMSVCNVNIDTKKMVFSRLGATQAVLSGKIDPQLVKSKTCKLEIHGEHPAFGSITETLTAELPEMIKDQVLGSSELKMRQLAELTGAELLWANDGDKTKDKLNRWLEDRVAGHGEISMVQNKIIKNHYWILDSWWFFILLLFLPLEIIVRRWDKLVLA